MGAIMNGAAAFINVMGVVWHIWAAKQHKNKEEN
jgi:hypothetical protein